MRWRIITDGSTQGSSSSPTITSVGTRVGLDPLALEGVGRRALAAHELLARDRARAAAHDDHALRHRGVRQREVEGDVGAHRAAADVGVTDAEPEEELAR
jgi:hypothetical protein